MASVASVELIRDGSGRRSERNVKMIYAELRMDGQEEHRFFDNWEQFHQYTFSPEWEILKVVDMNKPQTVKGR